ncbi:MAG: hypothetical protein Tsb009_06440 [Planctomycetaceae bacterium]
MIEKPTEKSERLTPNLFSAGQLFHGFRTALSVPQILIAACGVVILAAGQWAISFLPFAPDHGREWVWPWVEVIQIPSFDISWGDKFFSLCSGILALLCAPLLNVYRPFVSLLSLENDWQSAAYAWTQLFWALAVWSIFGGAVTRMAAVRYAVDQSVGLKAGLKFSCGKFLSFFTAPLLPGAGLLLLWMLCLVGGWIGKIPTAGPVIVGAFWFLALLLAFVMSLIVIGILGSWPLMLATIGTEASDAFDGFSRSFSYVYSRTRQLIGLILTAAFYGVATLLFAIVLTSMIAYFASWSVSSGMGSESVNSLTAYSPFESPRGLNPGDTTASKASVDDSLAPQLVTFWLNVLCVLLHGFAASLFWSLAVIAYFQLRFSDDGTPLNEVYLPEDDEEQDLLPLVGMSASDHPAIERPVEEPSQDAEGNDAESTEDKS